MLSLDFKQPSSQKRERASSNVFSSQETILKWDGQSGKDSWAKF